MGFFNKKFSQLSDKKDIIISKNKLVNTSWLKTNTGSTKITYSFLNNGELIISSDGDGTRAKWEFVVDSDTLILESDKIEVFNCQIIHDEFLILNKDNTESLDIFGNLSKFKNNQEKEVQSKFDMLFERLSMTEEISPKDKFYILKIYEISNLLENGSNKARLKKLINNLVHDETSGLAFERTYKKVLNRELVQSLNQSRYNRNELIDITENLIKYRIVVP